MFVCLLACFLLSTAYYWQIKLLKTRNRTHYLKSNAILARYVQLETYSVKTIHLLHVLKCLVMVNTINEMRVSNEQVYLPR